MQVLANNGAVTANGRYTFANNQLSGSYTYTNGGLFYFAATLEGNTFNGSWGSDPAAKTGGRWIMNKAGNSAVGNIR
jgi:hypothetical protein